jgi:hypothetical protein
MAVNVNADNLPEEGEGRSKNPETKFIKAGNRVARVVQYVEMGKHHQMFKGKKAVYEQGKNAGRQKPPVLHVALTFEFPAEEYTGDYPLTISTSRRMDNGEFFDAVTVPESLADGSMSKAYAMRTRFMKYLTNIQAATGLNYTNFADFAKAQAPIMVKVTNKLGAKKEDGSQPTYANMKPDGITKPAFEHPTTGEVIEVEVPEAKGEYPIPFEWDAPTEESWKGLQPWYKKAIKEAVDFAGSPIDMLLQANPELDAVQEPSKDQDQSDPRPPEPEKNVQKQEDIPV